MTSIGVIGQLECFRPLGRSESGRFTWAQFRRGGWAEAQGQDIPFVDRFRLGGEFSARGHPTNSLGPLDAHGVPLGGGLFKSMGMAPATTPPWAPCASTSPSLSRRPEDPGHKVYFGSVF